MSDFGTMYATWTDPDGNVWQLSNTADTLGWFTTRGPGGWGAAPVELVTDPRERGGVSLRKARLQERRLTWPLEIWGDTHDQFVERYRSIVTAFTRTIHQETAGTLTISRPNGSTRLIDAFYEDGLQGEPGENWSYARPVITLLCPEPYWRAETLVTEPRTFATSAPFLAPFPTVSSSAALGSSLVGNAGDVDTYPSFTITGPLTQLQATNVTTGDSFQITYPLLLGQTITVWADPPTILGPGGENLTSALNFPYATLWRLVPGDNTIDFTAVGGAVGTSVTMTYTPRFETA